MQTAQSKVNFLEGNPRSSILKLAWPMVIAMIANAAFNIIDTAFVGRLGKEALAAVGISFPIVFLLLAFAVGTSAGIQSFIARSLGAGDKNEADNVAEHAVFMTFIFGGIFAFLGLMFGKYLYPLVGATPDILPLVNDYMSVLFASSFLLFVVMFAMGIFQGEGSMKHAMVMMIIGLSLNTILDPILIYMLDMGVKGAAYATVIGRFCGMLYACYYLFIKKSVYLQFKFRHFRFKLSILKEIFRVGIPSIIAQLAVIVGIVGLNILVSRFGSTALASFTVGVKIDAVVFMLSQGFAMSTMTLVGMAIGAKKYKLAKQFTYESIKIIALVMVFLAMFVFSFADQIVQFFIVDAEVVKIGAGYLRIIAYSYPIFAIAVVLGGALQGAGRGIAHMFLSFLRMVIAVLPLAYLFAFVMDYGITGIWFGILLGWIVVTIFSVLWFVWVDLSKSKKFYEVFIGGIRKLK